MKVYVWIKHKEYPDPKIRGGCQKGDLVFIYPMVNDQGKLTQDHYFPIVMDLNIPCGKDFNIINGQKGWNCNKCLYHDPDSCDVIKFTCATWSAGTLDEMPTILDKYRYKVDIDAVLDVSTKILVEKPVKSEADKITIINYAKEIPQIKSVLVDKAVVK